MVSSSYLLLQVFILPLTLLYSSSILQQTWKLLLARLKIGIAANVLLLDIDVRDRALPIYLPQGSLDVGSIGYKVNMLASLHACFI